MTVAALFVRSDSVYKGLPGVEAWDFDRNADGYAGPWPVVAHPPCGAWGRFRRHVERASGRKADEERRCGLFAVDCVRKWGGVLEQPACSDLWNAAGLPLQGVDAFGGFTLQVCQSWWGHKAEKCTWLYVVNCGRSLPSFSADLGIPRSGLLQLGRRDREATPEAFALWLVAIAAGGHSLESPFDQVAIAAGGHSLESPFDQVAIRPGHSAGRPVELVAIRPGGGV